MQRQRSEGVLSYQARRWRAWHCRHHL